MSVTGVSNTAYQRTSKDLWEIALFELKGKSELSFDIGRTDRRVVLEEVLSKVQEKEDLCRRSRWKWKNRHGETVIVRDVFAKMIKWINKFKEIGDTIVQYDPAHAALPWAAIRFVLQVAVNDAQIHGVMAEGLELILNLIAKYEIVERMFLGRSAELEKELSESIVKLYGAILLYLSEIHKYFSKSTAGRLASSIIRTAESSSKECIDKIRSAESAVNHYVQLDYHGIAQTTSRDVRAVRSSVEQLFLIIEGVKGIENGMQNMDLQVSELRGGLERLESILTDLSQPVSRIASALSTIEDNLDEKQRLEVFEWLTDVRYTSHHKEKAKSLLKGSGRWLLEKPEFVHWMTSSTSSILWLHGIPGSGKSMLVAAVIDYLRSRDGGIENLAPLGFFYCARNTNEPERADPTVILRSILEQLSSESQYSPIRGPVTDAYLSAKKEARGRRPDQLNLEEAVDIVLALLETNPATIVLDGLDECNPQKRQELLNALQKIIKESDNIVKVFVSSRDDHDLVHRLAGTPNLYIRAADNRNDIKSFVYSRISDAIKDGRLLCGNVSVSTKQLITETLIEKAQGMFRLVSLHIETLCDPQNIKTDENVRITLRRLPKDLSKSYSLILEQIRNSEEPNPKIAENTLRWLLCAKETLPSEALAFAVRDNTHGSDSVLTRSEILDICSNLVIYDAESDVFRFAHLSVREYLEDENFYGNQQNNAFAAERCLTYLLDHTTPEVETAGSPENKHSKANQEPSQIFRGYCFDHWVDHVRLAPDRRKEGTLQHCFRKFLLGNGMFGGFERTTWLRVLNGYLTSQQPLLKNLPELWYSIDSSPNILFVACALGFSEIVQEIVSDVESISFNFKIRSVRGLNCAETAAAFNQTHLIPILFYASQKAGVQDEYWHLVIRTLIKEENFPQHTSMLYALGQIFDCRRDDFVTAKVVKFPCWYEPHPPVRFARLYTFAKILDCCKDNFITAKVFKDVLPALFNRQDAREGSLYETLRPPHILKKGEIHPSLTPAFVPTDVESHFQSSATLISQVVGKCREPFVAIKQMTRDFLYTEYDEDNDDKFWKEVLQVLDPEIGHTFLVLYLGDVVKVKQLLRKVHLNITAEVIEATAGNVRHGKNVMALLLIQNPSTHISDHLLQTAMITGNLEVVNVLFSHNAFLEAKDRSLVDTHSAMRESVLEFMRDLEAFCSG